MTSIHSPGDEFTTGPGEPVFSSYKLVSFDAWFAEILALSESKDMLPRVIAVDGRGGSGKSTLATKMAAAYENAVIIHTDDIAWHLSRFDWDTELAEHVLKPLLAREPVDYVPPGWASHGREGSLSFSPAPLIIVEGSGCIRPSLAPYYGATVFVQSDFVLAKARGVERDLELGVNGDREQAEAFWDSWAIEEISFLQKTRPWQEADFVVVGHALSELPEGIVKVDDMGQRLLDQPGDECLVIANTDE